MNIEKNIHLSPQLQFMKSLGFDIALRLWGDTNAPTILAMHGLGGHGLNFGRLAPQLADQFCVVAPDMIGRGLSEWSSDPARAYCFDTYESITIDLVDQLGLGRFGWLGVSMGGALGMRMAGGVFADRIAGLVLNDIGPTLDNDMAEAIQNAMQQDLRFRSIEALADHFAQAFGQFGMKPAPDWSWLDMAIAGGRRRDDGSWALHFDPDIALQLRDHRNDFDLERAFSALGMPLLLFRGAESNVLTAENASEMRRIHPNCQFELVPNTGHAPLLDLPKDAARISTFFRDCLLEGAQ